MNEKKKKKIKCYVVCEIFLSRVETNNIITDCTQPMPKGDFFSQRSLFISLSLSRGFSSSRSFERDSNNLTELKKIFEIFSIFSHCRISNRYFFFFSSSQLIANCSIMFEFVFYSNSFFVLISFFFFVYLFFRCFILQADFTTLSLSPSLLPL